MNRFTRNIAILIIGEERLVYVRDRNIDINEVEAEMNSIIFREGDPNVSVAEGKSIRNFLSIQETTKCAHINKKNMKINIINL